MKGRIRGNRDRIIILAHQIEAMARQKKLKPVNQYFRQTKRAKRTDSPAVIDMLRRMKRDGAAISIKRLKATKPKE